MRQKLKKILAVILILIVVINQSSVQTKAESYINTGKYFTIKSGSTTYTYRVYLLDADCYAIFDNLDVCPPIYHSKNKGETTLTYTQSKTYTSQTAYQFSQSLGMSASKSVVSGTVNVTSGKTKTKTYSVSASGSVGRRIPSSAETGYYKLSICHDFNKYKLYKYKGNSHPSIIYAGLPTGNAYVSVLYGTTTRNSDYIKY